MTKDKFQELCEQVLMPRLGDFIHQQLTTMHETEDTMARELARIGDAVARIAAQMERTQNHADQR